MENSNIHKSLLELEGSLKDLQSARTQVNSFSVKSEQMLDVYTKILNHLESLQNNIDKENNQIKKLFSEKYHEVNDTMNNHSKAFGVKSEKYINILSESSQKVLEKINELEYSINDTMNNQSKAFGAKSEIYINMLSESSQKVHEKINELEYSINDASDKINQIDLTKSLSEFESKINGVNNTILSYKKDLERFRESVNYNLRQEFKENSESMSKLDVKVNIIKQETSKVSQETISYIQNQNNNIEELDKKIDKRIKELDDSNMLNLNNISVLRDEVKSFKKQNMIFLGLIALTTIIMNILILVFN